MNILLAGAGGQVGRRVLSLLQEAGHVVQAVSGRHRDLTQPGAARGLGEGNQVFVSCAGASVSIGAKDKRPYSEVDPAIHAGLIAEAERTGVRRFVYLGVHAAPHYTECAYMEAHEAVGRMLRGSRLSYTIVRPTGIFSAFADLLPMAKRGVLPLIGSGEAKTNPIDPQDVAEIVVRHLEDGPAEVACGGPEVMTRREVNLCLAKAVGRPEAWMPKAPGWLVRAEAKGVRLINPRMAELMEFFSLVASADAVAPALGRRRMSEYFRQEN